MQKCNPGEIYRIYCRTLNCSIYRHSRFKENLYLPWAFLGCSRNITGIVLQTKMFSSAICTVFHRNTLLVCVWYSVAVESIFTIFVCICLYILHCSSAFYISVFPPSDILSVTIVKPQWFQVYVYPWQCRVTNLTSKW